MSPARACALAVVRRVFERGAYADRALAAEAAGLEPRDRALATQIAYGTVQRRLTLDHVAGQLLRGPLGRLEPAVRAVLRIGLFQLLYLDGVPDHAAVDESVELVKRSSPGGGRVVNAVLRRAAREAEELLAALSDATPADAAVAHSVPQWLAELWWSELGSDEARALLRAVNRPAESALRVNSLVCSPAEVRARLPVQTHPAPALPEGLVLEGPFDLPASNLFQDGSIMPQSRASMLVARVLAPHTGDAVLDLCAAPGAKTTHLAALIEDRGSVIAVERHSGRARALEATAQRMRGRSVRVLVRDALDLGAYAPGLDSVARGLGAKRGFDRVLLDPPCSGLGTLQSRPDRRWRASAEAIEELAGLQARLLAVAARATRPGGVLVYSLCTISEREGTGVVDDFLASTHGWEAAELGAAYPQWAERRAGRYLQLLPHRDGTDGFFIACLRRVS